MIHSVLKCFFFSVWFLSKSSINIFPVDLLIIDHWKLSRPTFISVNQQNEYTAIFIWEKCDHENKNHSTVEWPPAKTRFSHIYSDFRSESRTLIPVHLRKEENCHNHWTYRIHIWFASEYAKMWTCGDSAWHMIYDMTVYNAIAFRMNEMTASAIRLWISLI